MSSDRSNDPQEATMENESFLFQRWPRYAYRHAGRVIPAPFAVIVALGVPFTLAPGEFENDFSVSGSEAQQLFNTLEERFPSNAGDQATIVVNADAGLGDPSVSAGVATLVSRLETLPEVTGVEGPAASDISADGTIARINVQYGVQAVDLDHS
jgi:RND superfamily putative drug exporter